MKGIKNKKGAEMTIGTLVIIVLAIIVLVVIALGFGMGWSNLWSRITGYFSPVNVDAVKQACIYACTTQASYDWCTRERDMTHDITLNGKLDKQTIKITCDQWANKANVKTKANDLPIPIPSQIGTLDSCPAISCNQA
ncbi:hypothetical protein HYW76_01855 [Candidatus Pacearchaeota archaeon]|nr:hypothetical protein [Candidatus Pacearchaeota archaeon]